MTRHPATRLARDIPWATFRLEEVKYNVDEKSP